MDAHQPHNRRYAIAIEAQVFESLVLDGEARNRARLGGSLKLLDIHRRAVSEFIQQSCRNRVAALCINEGQQNRIVGGLALLGTVQSVEPGVKFLAPFGKAQRGIVANVVASPHEGVNSAQRLALAAGKNEKGIIKILGGSARYAFAHRIRHHELRRSRRPGNRDLLCPGAHRPLSSLGWSCFRPASLAPSTAPAEKNFFIAARATSASFRGFEIAGRFPRTA